MADNYTGLDASAASITVAADEIAAVKYPRVKLTQGADGTATDVSSAAPLEVTIANGTVPSHAVTNAGTFAVQAAQSGTWNVTNVSGTVSLPTGASTAAKQPALGVAGTASTDVLTVQGIASMTALKVDGSAVTQPVSGTVTANAGSGTMAVSAASLPLPSGASTAAKQPALGTAGTPSADVITVQGVTSMTALKVDGSGVTQPVSGTVNAAQSGTWTVQPGNTANTTAWKVDGSAVTQPVSMATNTPVGNVAHDGVDSGAPIKVGTRAVSALSSATLVAAADRSDAVADLDGAVIVRDHFPLGDLKSDATSNTDGASTASTVFTAVASAKNYITSFQIFRTDAGTTPIYIDFRDGTAGAVLWRAVLPPNGGSNSPSSSMPLFKTSANTALAYDVSAATSTVYINVSGFQSKL